MGILPKKQHNLQTQMKNWQGICGILTGGGVILITAFIIYASIAGGGWAEVKAIFSLPWGIMTLVDVYLGFMLIILWVCLREDKVWKMFIWGVAILTLGNFATCLYAFIAIVQSQGKVEKLMLGSRYYEKVD